MFENVRKAAEEAGRKATLEDYAAAFRAGDASLSDEQLEGVTGGLELTQKDFDDFNELIKEWKRDNYTLQTVMVALKDADPAIVDYIKSRW